MNDCAKYTQEKIPCVMTRIPAREFVADIPDGDVIMNLLDNLELLTVYNLLPQTGTRSGLSLVRKGGSAQDWLDHETKCKHQSSNHRPPWISTNVDELIVELQQFRRETQESE